MEPTTPSEDTRDTSTDPYNNPNESSTQDGTSVVPLTSEPAGDTRPVIVSPVVSDIAPTEVVADGSAHIEESASSPAGPGVVPVAGAPASQDAAASEPAVSSTEPAAGEAVVTETNQPDASTVEAPSTFGAQTESSTVEPLNVGPVVPQEPQPSAVPVQPAVEPVAAAVSQPEIGATSAVNPSPAPSVQSTAQVMGSIAGATVAGRPVEFGSSKRKKLLFVGIIVLVVLLVVGGVFGYYIPNKPANVWKRGMNRTGQALDTIVTEATKTAESSTYKRTNIKGDFKLTSSSLGNFSANIDGWGSSTDAQLNTKVDIKEQGLADRTMSADLLAAIPSGKQYPDLYLQLTGLSQLGLDAFVPGVNQYDGKWLYVGSDYLQSLADSAGIKTDTNKTNITASDISNFTSSMVAVSREYVLTGDSSKGILEDRGFLGKEMVDGVKTNHYKVGYNKANFKQFCSALGESVLNSQLAKKFVTSASDRTKDQTSFVKSCQDSTNNIKPSDTFEMWVGGKYGLVRQVRFYDTSDKKNYMDVGQQYNGGDELTLYANLHLNDSDTKGTVHLSFTDNAKTGAITLDASAATTGTDKLDLTAHFAINPARGSTKITRPTDTIDLGQLIQQLQAQTSQVQAQVDAQQQQVFAAAAAANSGVNSF